MKLYLLKRRDKEGCWDLRLEILVRARDSRHARKLAHAEANQSHERSSPDYHADWLRPPETSCRQVKAEGKPGVIIVDFLNG